MCDQPHPLLVGSIIGNCLKLKIDDAYDGMRVSNSLISIECLLCTSTLLPPPLPSYSDHLKACCPVISAMTFVLLQSLCDLGYSAMDIITTVFRVVRNYDMQEFLKLEFIKVTRLSSL